MKDGCYVDRAQLDGSLAAFFGSLSLCGLINQFWADFLLVQSNGKVACLGNALAPVRSLEAQGVPLKQAETITATTMEVLNDNLENGA